jgi:hypothetical protein
MRRYLTLASVARSIASLSSYFLVATCSLVLSSSAFASTETVLYDFTGNQDGANPIFGMVSDSAGNLYGTTPAGGSGLSGNAFGTVFELTRSGDNWTENVLHNFAGGEAGATPMRAPSWIRRGDSMTRPLKAVAVESARTVPAARTCTAGRHFFSLRPRRDLDIIFPPSIYGWC